MKYLALIYGDESAWESFSEAERAEGYAAYTAFGEEARKAGVIVAGDELASTSTATTVRVRDGRQLVTDGPTPKRRRCSAASTCWTATRWRRRSTGRPRSPPPTTPRSRCARSTRIQPRRSPRRHARGGVGRYALMVYGDQSAWAELSEEEAAARRAESMPAWIACFEELGKADPDMTGYELEAADEAKVSACATASASSRTARSPRRRSRSAASSSPSCPTSTKAIRLAALVPAAQYGSMEVRPIVEH